MKKTFRSKSSPPKKEFGGKKDTFAKGKKGDEAKSFKRSDVKKSFDTPGGNAGKTRSDFTRKKDDSSSERKGYLGKKENFDPEKQSFPARKAAANRKEYSNIDRKEHRDKSGTSDIDKKTWADKKGSAVSKEKYSKSSKPFEGKKDYRESSDSTTKSSKTPLHQKDNFSRLKRDHSDKREASPKTYKSRLPVQKMTTTDGAKASVKRAIEVDKDPNTMRLNRYLSMCGIASRRKADELIESGKVKLNGKVVTEPGTKWNKGDIVVHEGKKLEPQQLVYILLNKPKNTIATNSDEKGRKTVFDHIDEKLAKLGLIDLRLFTVGRLDRNSLGVLLITNDGDLAQDLTHPSKEVEKIYQVQLDKNVAEEDMEKLAAGITLEDGLVHCDKIAYVHEMAKDEVGVEIHSGKNRIVRRMFESLGYEVIKLDRVSFAGLTKKDLPRGKWRFLKENEIRQLKHFNKPKLKTKTRN